MQRVMTCLGFDSQGEEAIDFYTSTVRNSKIQKITRWGDSGPGPKGSMIAGSFVLDGQEFMALNGGPSFKFSTAMSIVIRCDTQEEIDELWEKLSAGGKPGQCGWLQDKYGVSWQIIPRALPELLGNADPVKAQKAMKAMLQMKKLDIAELKAAAERP